MTTPAAGAALRCAHHPARPALDQCPRCDRQRCAADAAMFGDTGCGICQGGGEPVRRSTLLEVGVRAGVGGVPAAGAGGWIATQYVQDHIFSLVVPGLVGFACALVATIANSRRDRPAAAVILAVAVVAAVLGTALGFHLVPGGRQSVLRPLNVVAAPYACAVIGVFVWPVLFGMARRSE